MTSSWQRMLLIRSILFLFSLALTWYETSVLLEQVQENTSERLFPAHAPKLLGPVHFPKLFVCALLPPLPQVRPSCFGSVTLYDYLKSLFSVWKRIPFEASLIGSAPFPHFASTTAILAPSRGIGFYWSVGCLMALGGWETLGHAANDWTRVCRLVPFWFLNVIFLSLQQCYHTYRYCGLHNVPDYAAWSFETAAGIADFTLWGRGAGRWGGLSSLENLPSVTLHP